MAEQIVYLNGAFLRLSEAKVSVLDRGFLLGDGVYEVFAVYEGRILRRYAHFHRLEASLAAVGIENPLTRDAWNSVIDRLIQQSDSADLSIYIQVTRGVACRMLAFPSTVTPTCFAMALPRAGLEPALQARGIAAISVADLRWHRCDIKSTSLLASVLSAQYAVEVGAKEAIFFRDGWLTEAVSSNVCLVQEGQLVVPPPSTHLLLGVTSELVLELAAADGIPIQKRPISQAEVQHADELWLTSSTQEIVAVTSMDGIPVGDGLPGLLYQRVFALYQQNKRTQGPDWI